MNNEEILKQYQHFYNSFLTDQGELLETLKGKTDAISIRQQLAILLSVKQNEKAAELIKDIEPDIEWYDLAITALINNDNKQKIKELLKWASKQGTDIWHKAIYLYVTNQYQRTWRNRNNQKIISKESLSTIEIQELKELTDNMQPILKLIEGMGKATNNIYKEINTIAIRCYALLGDKSNASKYALFSENHPLCQNK